MCKQSVPMTVLDSVKTWPFEEARKLLKRIQSQNKSMVTFETGYGPSGLPHIGTFGEVVRTSMVRLALAQLCDIPSRLLCFSDDMDGLRKVPDNIPNGEKLRPFLNMPLTQVPDPFGQYASFGAHNNARLQAFIDEIGLDYTFMSATDCYTSGMFDEQLLRVLHHHRAILDVILPTLGVERQKTYSPFLPISPSTGRVLQVPMEEYRETTVVFRDEDGRLVEQSVTGGQCKLQWKVDWGMRWVALGVDYEMCGKDLIDSVTLATKVCRILGGLPPENLTYEHFLDEAGGKISKSKGNGLSVEEWLRFAPMESLSYFMYNTPRRAKRLFFDVIPKHVDEYIQHLAAFPGQTPEAQISNPVWAIHGGTPPTSAIPPVTFALLLNLVSVCQGQDKALVWAFITRAYPDMHPENQPMLDELVGHAVVYYQEKVVATKRFRPPTEQEKAAFEALIARLRVAPQEDAHGLQTLVYEIGNAFFPVVKDWFDAFYQVLFGQQSGPRVGSFIALYGKEDTCALIESRLK
jgi:lysyl-tRNA synthetase class 1